MNIKLLWIVNTIFPYPAEKLGIEKTVFGGWLNGLADKIKEDKEIEIAIATTYYGNDVLKYKDENVIYYLIPGAPAIKYNKLMEEYWKKVNDDFNPNLVHIHGTEFSHGLAFKKACPNVKSIVSIQGICEKISQNYYGGMTTLEILTNITLRDIIRKDTIFHAKRKFEIRAKNERDLVKLSNAIIGRTTYDYANIKAINPDINYYLGNETLRKTFYNKEWKIENIERHTIFCSQAGYPLKGLHFLLEAVYILKKRYLDIKLYIAGDNIVDTSTLNAKLRLSGYAKYLNKLIKSYKLEENIIFTGMLNEEQMEKRFSKSHVFVLASSNENSSNSLGEAMLLRNAVCSI